MFVAGHNPTNLEGYEWNDLEAPINNEMATSNTVMSTGSPHSGAVCLQIHPIGSASYMELPNRFTAAGFVNGSADFNYCPSRFYAKILFNGQSGAQTGRFYTLCDGAPGAVADKLWLIVDASNQISLADGGGVIAGPSTATLSGSNLLIEVFPGPSQVQVRLGGSELLTAAGSFPDLDSCMFGSRTAVTGGYVIQVDAWIVETSDSATAVDWPGPGAIVRLDQDSDVLDGSFLNEGASATNLYQSVDETTAPDGDATYVRGNVSHDAFRFGFETAASAGISGVIAAVKVQTRARNEASSPSFETRVRSTAGTDVDTLGQNFTSSYLATQSVVHKSPPGTSADWATADIDALEVGGRIGANVAEFVRVTTQVVQVDFNTGTTPATFRARVNPQLLGGKHALLGSDTPGGG